MMPMVTKFTTTSENYDLLQDSEVLNKIADVMGKGAAEKLSLGISIRCSVEIKMVLVEEEDTTTLIINGGSSEQDLVDGTTWSSYGPRDFYSIVVKDSGKTGYITIH